VIGASDSPIASEITFRSSFRHVSRVIRDTRSTMSDAFFFQYERLQRAERIAFTTVAPELTNEPLTKD
jgi:hypothetical protein